LVFCGCIDKLQTASDPATLAGKIKVKPIIGGLERSPGHLFEAENDARGAPYMNATQEHPYILACRTTKKIK
jgi:hypothetical protein